MHVYIQTDIEGIAGFTFFENPKDDSHENYYHRQRMRRLLTAEVNAAVTAAFDSGAESVVINDSHGSGYNLQFEELDPRCEIIHGRNCSGPHWLPELDSGIDALVLVGMHAMGGTPNAIVSHSLWEVNRGALYMSEACMAAAIAGEHGIPTVFVSGDDKICAELRDRIPNIVTAVVKKGLGAYQARSLIPRAACALIAEKVCRGLQRRGDIPPFVIPGPIELNLLDSPGHSPPFQPVLKEPVRAETMEAAFLALENAAPWTHFHTEVPDGFVYP